MSSSNPYPVEPPGFFLGSLLACVLYGVHVAQVYSFLDSLSRRASTYHRYLVCWVLALSTAHMLVVWSASYRYFVVGTSDLSIWGEFWWVLSVQDGLVPLMAATAQYYFGRRAWILSGRKRWIMIFTGVMPTITLGLGAALAITARAWSVDPWISPAEMASRPIGVPSQIVAIAWMGCSAFTDGLLSSILIYYFFQARRGTTRWTTRRIAKRFIALTLETVLLTHVVGAIMCIIFLASPAAHRTKNNLFWVLLEIITELYALSILFTIIHHESVRVALKDEVYPVVQIGGNWTEGQARAMRQTELDWRVEGHRASSFVVEVSGEQQDSSQPSGGIGSSTIAGDSPWTPAEQVVLAEVSYFGRMDEASSGSEDRKKSNGSPG